MSRVALRSFPMALLPIINLSWILNEVELLFCSALS